MNSVNAKLTPQSPTGRLLVGDVAVTPKGSFTLVSVDTDKPVAAGLSREKFEELKGQFALEEVTVVKVVEMATPTPAAEKILEDLGIKKPK